MIARINTDWLSGTFAWVLRTTWQAALLAILVLAAMWLLRQRLTARMRCLMWGIVVLRLLMPPLPQTRWTLFHGVSLVQSSKATVRDIIHVAERQPSQNRTPERESIVIARIADAPLPIPAPVAQMRVTPAVRWSWPGFGTVLLSVWLTGVALFGIRLILASVRLVRLVRRCPVLNDPAIESLAADCAVKAGLPYAPVLLRADHLSGPAVTGLFSPRLLLPRDLLATFSAAELRLMLLHEFAHLRRRDLHLSWLLGVLQAVHWFNPPLRWVFNHLRADCELACDEFVLRLAASNSPDEQGRTYGHALLRLAEKFTQSHPAVSSQSVGQIGILDGPHNLQRRIVMITQFNPASRTLSRTWPVVFVGGLLICSGVLLADAVEPSKPKGAVEAGKVVPPPAAALSNQDVLKKSAESSATTEAKKRELDKLVAERNELETEYLEATVAQQAVRENMDKGKDPSSVDEQVSGNPDPKTAANEVLRARHRLDAAKEAEAKEDAQRQLDLAVWNAKDVESRVRADARSRMAQKYDERVRTLRRNLFKLDVRLGLQRLEISGVPAPMASNNLEHHRLERQSLVSELEIAKSEVARLRTTLADTHPKVEMMNERIQRLDQVIRRQDLLIGEDRRDPLTRTTVAPAIEKKAAEAREAASGNSPESMRAQAEELRVKQAQDVLQSRKAELSRIGELQKLGAADGNSKAEVAVAVQVATANVQAAEMALRMDQKRKAELDLEKASGVGAGDSLESLAVAGGELRVKAAAVGLKQKQAELKRVKSIHDAGAQNDSEFEMSSTEVELADLNLQQEQVNLRVAKVHERARAALRGEGAAGKP